MGCVAKKGSLGQDSLGGAGRSWGTNIISADSTKSGKMSEVEETWGYSFIWQIFTECYILLGAGATAVRDKVPALMRLMYNNAVTQKPCLHSSAFIQYPMKSGSGQTHELSKVIQLVGDKTMTENKVFWFFF